MREIKFRAWNNLLKVMRHDSLQVLEVMADVMLQKDIDAGRYIPMQYTGLKDKNGKEIYEGDIVLIEDEQKERILDDGSGPVEPCNHLAPVLFQDGSFGVNIMHPALGLATRGFWSFRDINSELGLTEFEVIGNIYENPELLK